jgi:hypothetical protein
MCLQLMRDIFYMGIYLSCCVQLKCTQLIKMQYIHMNEKKLDRLAYQMQGY